MRGDVITKLGAKRVVFGSGRVFERAAVNRAIWSEPNCAAMRDRLQKQATLPELLAVRLARLFTADQHADYSGISWRRAQAGALAFALEWGLRALEAKWRPIELFGLHPAAPAARYDCKGLAWLLNDRWRVTSINDDCAVITTITGATLTYRRKKVSEIGSAVM
jgi:hypothetical protein